MLSARRDFLVALAAGLFMGRPRAAEGQVLKDASGEAAPPVDLLRPDGAALTLRDLRGRVVVVNFWATWCEPCVAEMPSLQRLRDQVGPERMEVLGVNHKEGPARITAFAEKAGITFPLVRDTDGAVARAWGARIFPSSYVIDREGRIRYSLVGEADWTSPAVVSKILPLLGSQPSR